MTNSKFLYRWPAVCIHGDKSQNERDWVLQGKILIMLSYNIFLFLLFYSLYINYG